MPTESQPTSLSGWALVLGASSGFGAATSMALARAGLNVFGVHLDRKASLPNAERLVGEIKGLGREARFYNINAADEERRAETAADMERILRERGEEGQLRVMLHSLAFGTLKLIFEDLRFGNASSMVVSLLFYGLVLILLPKLIRRPQMPS